MVECDRYKPYISDYLENNLDPSTQQEFENALNHSKELQILTNRVQDLKSRLGNLSSYSCSEDFSLKLREKIHTKPQPVFNKQLIMRLSFAATFVLIMAFAIINLSNVSDTTDSTPPVQGNSDLKFESSNPAPSPNQTTFKKAGEVEIKTKMTQQVIDDSSSINHLSDKKKDDPYMKRIDKKE